MDRKNTCNQSESPQPEARIKEAVTQLVQSVSLSEQDSRRCLLGIHKQLKKRSITMKISHKKLTIAVAAAMITLGAATAFAAGQITSYVTSVNKNDAIENVAELKSKGKAALGTDLRIPEGFSNGLFFSTGFVTTVDALDADNNKVAAIPDVMAYYGDDENLYLDIQQPVTDADEEELIPVTTESYQNLTLTAYSSDYLFLPPDAVPSEEDQALEAEGKLFISYGSKEEERKTFLSVKWEEDGVIYLLSTFENKGIDEIIGIAKEVVDSEK